MNEDTEQIIEHQQRILKDSGIESFIARSDGRFELKFVGSSSDVIFIPAYSKRPNRWQFDITDTANME